MKTEEKIKRLKDNPDFQTAVTYASGTYMLLSVMILWWDLMEDHLRKAGCLCFDFKHEFLACKAQLEKFEKTLARNVSSDQKLPFCNDFEKVEPVLRKFIFGEEK